MAQVSQSREARNKQAALYHANVLQHQKDTEFQILDALETLLDLPSSEQADPVQPSAEDVHTLKRALALFQTSDYDALIEERNINRLCGYALCPRPNKTLPTSATRIIIQDKGQAWDPLKVVDRKALEHWCSDNCAKRALYLKVQLNEEPAWERAGRTGSHILLLDENELNHSADIPTVLKPRKLSSNVGEDTITSAMQTLAIERGNSHIDDISHGLAGVIIAENLSSRNATPPASGHDLSGYHNSIEGYRPHGASKGTSLRTSAEVSEDDDDSNDLSSIMHQT